MNRGLWCPIKTHVTNLSGGSYNEDTKLQCAVEYCSMASVVGFGGGMIRGPWSWSNLLNNQIKSNHFSFDGLSWDFWFLGLFLNFWPPPRSRIRAPDQICSTIKSFQLGWAFLAAVSNTIPKSFSSSSQFDFAIKDDTVETITKPDHFSFSRLFTGFWWFSMFFSGFHSFYWFLEVVDVFLSFLSN